MLLVCALACAACREPVTFPEEQYDARMSGGVNSVPDNSSKAFSHAFPLLRSNEAQLHALGDAHFEQTFVTAPAPVNAGLGSRYNNVSCISCHRNDGSGFPTTGEPESALLLRISTDGIDAHGGPRPVPSYGGQLQDKAIIGWQPECAISITYEYRTVELAGGERCELRIPRYTLHSLHAPIGVPYRLSPRLAPPVFGLGLLEAVSEHTILSYADASDANGDGISGRPNRVWDAPSGSMRMGRFGWKANTATLLAQVAGAYAQDMGITSSIFPDTDLFESGATNGTPAPPELGDDILRAVTFYVRTLAVPQRRLVTDPVALRGERVFREAKCGSCHVPTLVTGDHMDLPSVSGQRIHAYTDLLLHDMGPELADDRLDFEASGREWRTAPLWGIGLFRTVSYPGYYLHDGRARTILEAVLFHGGEAEKSRQFVERLSPADRAALLRFLSSL